MADGRIIIDTQIDSGGAEKGISELSKKAQDGLKTMNKAFLATSAAIGGIGAYAVKVGSDFQEGMSAVQAISGATGKELSALTEKAKEMGAKTKFSATESAEAFQYMAMAGWKSADMLDGIEGIMNLAAASGEDLALVSDIVTDALTAFGMSAKDSAQFADLLASAASNSNTNVSMLGESFKYVAPVAGALGHSAQDTAFALGLMANSGIKASQSGTALRASLTNLANPTKKMKEEMDRLEISLIDSNGKVKEGKELYDELRQKFSNLTDAQKTQSAATIFGKEAMSGMLAIINASDEDYKKLYDSLNNSAGAAENMANIMNDNLKGSITLLKSAIEGAGIAFYEKFSEPAKKAVDKVADAFSWLTIKLGDGSLDNALIGIATAIGTITTAILAFKAGAVMTSVVRSWQEAKVALALYKMTAEGAAISQGVMNGVFTVWETIVALMTGKITLATAATGLWAKAQAVLNGIMSANPIGVVLVAIAALTGAIIYLWNTNEDFRNAVIDAWNAILDTGKAVWEWLVKFFTEDIPNAWQSMIDWFKSVPQWFIDLWENIKQVFIDGWNLIADFFTVTIPAWIEQIFNWFNELPSKIGYALGYALATIVKWGTDTWNYLVTNVPIWIENVVKFFSQLPGKIWTWLVATFNKIVTWGSQTYNSMITSVTNTINAIVNYFATLPSRIWEWLVSTIEKVIQFGIDLGIKAREAGLDMVENIIGAVKDLPSQFMDIGINIVKGVWEGIKSMGSWIADKVSGFFGGIVDGAKDALGIHSPSRVFRDQVGKYMAQGVGVGFEEESKNIEKSMQKDFSNLVSKMQATVNFETSKTSRKMISGANKVINTSTVTNNNDNGITQNVTIVNPERTPAENARALKKVGRDLVFG